MTCVVQGSCPHYWKGDLRRQQRPTVLAWAGQGLAGALAVPHRVCRDQSIRAGAGTTWEDPWDLQQPWHSVLRQGGLVPAVSIPQAPQGWSCGSRAGCTQALMGQGGDASSEGGLLGAECCGLGTLRPCGLGKAKVWGHFCTGGATAPLPTCALGSSWPWAGQLLSLSPTGSAEPFPPSRRPCGCSVPLKALQAWLWDHYPIPAGQGTGQSWTALDSPGQPAPAALAHCGPQPPQVRGCCGGPNSARPSCGGGQGMGNLPVLSPLVSLDPPPGERVLGTAGAWGHS